MKELGVRSPGLGVAPLIPDQVPLARDWLFCLGWNLNGTTALARVVSAHPRATLLNEAWIWGYSELLRTPELRVAREGWPRMANSRLLELRQGRREERPGWPASAIRELMEGLRRAVAPNDLIFGDKREDLTAHLDDLVTVFPQCRLMFALRDEWDLAGLRFDYIMSNGIRTDLTVEQRAQRAINWTRRTHRDIAGLIERYPAHDIKIARFDDFATDPETAIKEILDYLGLDHGSYNWDVIDTLHHARCNDRWKAFPELVALREAEARVEPAPDEQVV